MTARNKTARTAMTLLISIGAVVLTAAPVAALSHRGIHVHGTSVIDTNRNSDRPAPTGFNTAGGRISYR